MLEQEERPLVLTTRWFRRGVSNGAQVRRAKTRNFCYGIEVEHIEVSCPGFELTERGPVLVEKDEGFENDA